MVSKLATRYVPQNHAALNPCNQVALTPRNETQHRPPHSHRQQKKYRHQPRIPMSGTCLSQTSYGVREMVLRFVT